MLKKYKILTLITLLALLGIMGIMGGWLLDNYRYRKEMLVSDIDRSLFNSIQTYYHSQQDLSKTNGMNHIQQEGIEFAKRLRVSNPLIDSALVVNMWDSIVREKYMKQGPVFLRKKGKSSNAIISGFLLQDIDFNAQTIATLDSIMQENLLAKGLLLDIHLQAKVMEIRPVRRTAIHSDSEGYIHTRPVMVNPAASQYIVGKFKEPFWYILGRMMVQIVLVVIILSVLIGVFYYLIRTINRQNKMALLRKSFVNNMTHELKTPVSTVMAAVEAIQRYSAKDDKEKTAKFLQISQRELGHLASMIDKVLRLDIDESKGVVIQKDKVVINTLLTECLEVAKLSSEKPIKVNFNQPDAPLMVQGDYGHLKNVFNNLLDNAIKYSKEIVDLEIQTYEEEQNVYVSISDKGLGIDSVYQKDIFDMFFRVPYGHLHPVKGFGLGLPYVKQVIEKHGGQVKVSSKLHIGSTFTVIIPKHKS